jgi:hypothetical protein
MKIHLEEVSKKIDLILEQLEALSIKLSPVCKMNVGVALLQGINNNEESHSELSRLIISQAISLDSISSKILEISSRIDL